MLIRFYNYSDLIWIRQNLRSLYAKQILFKIQLFFFNFSMHYDLIMFAYFTFFNQSESIVKRLISELLTDPKWLFHSSSFLCFAPLQGGISGWSASPFPRCPHSTARPVLCSLWAGGVLALGGVNSHKVWVCRRGYKDQIPIPLKKCHITEM